MSFKSKILFFLIAHFACCIGFQTAYSQSVPHTKNVGARYNIDVKAMLDNPTSKEGLLRSREFIRIDSTYYMGYMWEGLYRAEYAADYLGYNLAIPPLKKAKELLEQDYATLLKKKVSVGYQAYIELYKIQNDYQMIMDKLWDSYMNTQQFQAAYDITTDYLPFELQLEYYFNGYIARAWIIHKLRLHKQKEFPFLKNNYLENVHLANHMLDSAVARIINNKKWLQDGLEDVATSNMMSVAHYRAMIYSYLINIDSADKYYGILTESFSYSHNNHGNYLSIKGQFEDAATEYAIEKNRTQTEGRKGLREYEYFGSILNIYQGHPHLASKELTNLIQSVGSTPGFGWYQIALARSLAYEGLFDKAQKAIDKAHNFKELHIGTSLNQEHYDFARNVVQYLIHKRKAAWYKQKYQSYWYNPRHWWTVIKNAWNTYSSKQIVLTQLSNNEERAQVIYKIFSSETVISWDELYELMDEMPQKFFIKKWTKELEGNKDRPLVLPYFELMLAKMYVLHGEEDKAMTLLKKMINAHAEKPQFDALLLARMMHLYATIQDMEGNTKERNLALMESYNLFPQLLAYSDVSLPVYIKWTGERNAVIEDKLSNANLDIQDVPGFYPQLNIEVVAQQASYSVSVSVLNPKTMQDEGHQKFIDQDIGAIANSVLLSVYQAGNKDR